MKPYPSRAPFYTSVPAVKIEGGSLYIQTSFFQQLSTLFSHCTRVHFNQKNKTVSIRVKQWWQWNPPIRIKIANIDYIDLTYPRVSEHQEDRPSQIHDLLLIARNPFQKIVLGRFGSAYSEDPVLCKIAESCAGLITKHTGIRFGVKPKKMPPAQFNDRYICKTCGHQLHPDSEFILCKYCGGKEIEIVSAAYKADGRRLKTEGENPDVGNQENKEFRGQTSDVSSRKIADV